MVQTKQLYEIKMEKMECFVDRAQKRFIRDIMFANGKDLIELLCRSDMYNLLEEYEKIRQEEETNDKTKRCGFFATLFKNIKFNKHSTQETRYDEKDVPEYSFIKSEYICGSKPTFNVGDRFYWYTRCDIPGETDYFEEETDYFEEETGYVTKVIFKEGNWVYIFDDGDEMTEEILIRLNAKVCRR